MTAQPSTQPATISLKQAARILNYSEGHVRRLISEGHIPKMQRDRGCAIRLDADVIEQLKRQWGR